MSDHGAQRCRACEHLTVLIAFSLITACCWQQLLFGHRTLFFGFAYRFFNPLYQFLSESVHVGTLPLWNPYIYSGIPFLANPQSAVFYPPSYLFALWTFPRALAMFVALHSLLGALSTYHLARLCGRAPLGACAAGVIFSFNGFTILHSTFCSNVASLSWSPLVVLLFTCGLQRRSHVYSVLTGVALAIQFLAGHPQFSYYTILFLCAWLAWNGSQGGPAASLRYGLAALAVAGGIFLVLTMAQLLPALELVLHSERSSGLGLESSAVFSIPPWAFLHFMFCPLWTWLPLVRVGADMDIVGFYFGYVACAAGTMALWRPSRLDLFCATVVTGAGVLAVGTHLPLYGWLHSYLPGWRLFRFPAQCLSIGLIPAALLVAAGIDRFTSRPVRTLVTGALCLELLIFGARAHTTVPDDAYGYVPRSVQYLLRQPQLFRLALSETARVALPATPHSPDPVRSFADRLYPNSAAAYGLHDAGGHETLRPGRYAALLGAIDGPSSPLLDLLNVRYVVSGTRLDSPKYRPADNGRLGVYENVNALSRFFLVTRPHYLPDDEILPYMRSPGFDPSKEVVLEGRPPAAKAAGSELTGPEARVELLSYTPNEIRLRVVGGRHQWLVMSESYYPGWFASVDGRPATVLRADYALRAVELSEGVHEVTVRYRPRSVVVGVAVSAVAVASLGCCALFLAYRRFRSAVYSEATRATLATTPVAKRLG